MSSGSHELPKGIHRKTRLPSAELDALWDSIVLSEAIKDQLLNQAVVNFSIRPRVPRSVLPLHGTILLVGDPGTGKTTLARGLASKTAAVFKTHKFTLLEVDPHALSSAMMGRTQKAVSDLFAQTIAEAAASGPTIVLLDEVETLAADRAQLSLQANPIDVHRATDAVLVQLDALAESQPNLLFVATSNFPQAVDAAFTSRCDLVLTVPLPDRAACEQILRSCLSGLGDKFPAIEQLNKSVKLKAVLDEIVGLDGRAIRKTLASAIAMRREVAVDPSKLTEADLLLAARAAKESRAKKGARV